MKPYGEFCSEMLPSLEEIPALSVSPGKKAKVLRERYSLSKEADKYQAKRLATGEEVKRHSRPTLRLYQRVEKALAKAHLHAGKAEAIYAQLPRPRKRAPWVALVREARAKLDVALRNIKIVTGLLVGEIDPSLQENKNLESYWYFIVNEEYDDLQKKWVDDYARRWTNEYDPSHVRSRAVEHWLAVEANSLLRRHVSVTDLQRYEIIMHLVKAALDQPITLKAISDLMYLRKRPFK